MELSLYFLREYAEQADTDCLGACGDLFYVGTVAGGAVGKGLGDMVWLCSYTFVLFVFNTLCIGSAAKDRTIISVFFTKIFSYDVTCLVFT